MRDLVQSVRDWKSVKSADERLGKLGEPFRIVDTLYSMGIIGPCSDTGEHEVNRAAAREWLQLDTQVRELDKENFELKDKLHNYDIEFDVVRDQRDDEHDMVQKLRRQRRWTWSLAAVLAVALIVAVIV